ncbi:hypothetical protein R3I93_003896 [Phoxinus phoxinus]|uniref:Nuclear mitotic apparatus protein 1 N-terminal hook domain-containing protein n=1 Tax=Phoxinus phoxinus TaxID=58324 RepID=A0AAN9DD93_9TELE
MELNGIKEAALLSWINSVCPEEPINKITQMMDGHRLLKLAYKVRGKESRDDLFVSPAPNMMEMLSSILREEFQFSPRQASLMFQKISQGIELELQTAKVVLVLCYCGFKRYNMVPLDTKTGLMIASMFHFVEDDADGLSLDDDLNKFLTKASVMTFSTSSSGSSCCSPLYTDDDGDESPFTRHFQKPRVQIQELVTVAGSSDRCPVQDKMSTPQLLKRLRKELAHGADVRDELEKELADQINVISEKEGLIVQLQHRVDRMLREQRELEKDHKAALLELQEKNESLLRRVHEVVKQCHDLKTENSLKDKKIDELAEENQTFAAQVRNTFAQLARAEEEVTKLTLAHESSLAEWRSRKEFLEHELNEAVTHRECLSEQVQILQGKVSVLEDELLKAQSQERGEVLGPIMEALNKIESFQSRILELSEQISLKDEEIRNLRNEYDSVDHELKLVKEQNIELIKSNRKEHEETVKLQQELHSASSAASEKQEEMLVLSAEVTSLKEQICRYSEHEVQKQQHMSVLETQHNPTSLLNLQADLLRHELCHQVTLQEKAQELEKTVRELQAEISERDAQISALKATVKDRQLKSDGLRAQLQLKLEKQNASILALKNLAGQWELQNKELLEKLKITFKQLQHYSSGHQALQRERDQAKAKVDFAEKRLQEWRKMIDDSEDVRCRESLKVRKRPGFHLHVPDTPESVNCISRKATIKSKHANRLSNSQQRQSVVFMIPNTPKSSGGGSLLRRGLRLHEDACKPPPGASGGLRKRPRNKSSKTSNAKPVNSRMICEQILDLFLLAIFLFVCLLFTL